MAVSARGFARHAHSGSSTRPRIRAAGVLLLGLLLFLGGAAPAVAHGDDESQEGYVLVEQAPGHLAHDTSSVGIRLAMEKVDDALGTEDQEGVLVA